MKLFPGSLRDYLKSHKDPSGVRRYLRLPLRIPVLYSFPERQGGTGPEFRQCYTADISQGGLALNVIDVPSLIRKKLLRQNQEILLKIDLPGHDDLVEFAGTVQWVRAVRSGSPERFQVGVRFSGIEPDDRIDILDCAVRLVNRRRFFRAFFILLIVSLFATGVWAVRSHFTGKEARRRLVVSESSRLKLEREVKLLDRKRSGLERELAKNSGIIARQDEMLERQKKVIGEMSLYIDHSKYLLEDIYREWNIDALSDFLVFDRLYQEGQKALREKKYSRAVSSLEELVKKYPDALLGYRLLITALQGEGRKEEANRVFQEYTQKIREQVIR